MEKRVEERAYLKAQGFHVNNSKKKIICLFLQ